MCKCSICGETLTAPVIIENQIFGWSCAKKIYPNISKPKNKWVEADSYFSETFENGNTYIKASLNGKNYIGHLIRKSQKVVASGVNIINDKAFINIKAYKKH